MARAFLGDAERLTAAEMDRWMRDFDWGICDILCFHLSVRSAHAWKKVAAWSREKGEHQKRASFALLASLAFHDKKSLDAPFLRVLPLVERAASDERPLREEGRESGAARHRCAQSRAARRLDRDGGSARAVRRFHRALGGEGRAARSLATARREACDPKRREILLESRASRRPRSRRTAWFETSTSDLERASKFYVALFGWTPEHKPMGDVKHGASESRVGSQQRRGCSPPKFDPPRVRVRAGSSSRRLQRLRSSESVWLRGLHCDPTLESRPGMDGGGPAGGAPTARSARGACEVRVSSSKFP